MSQWLRWDLNRGPPDYKPFSLTTGPHSLSGHQQLFSRGLQEFLFVRGMMCL
ncbi:UNVERIFIED_CONTAM: hypothetical protein FKN15_065452 [Acipenser sinensis]